MKYNAYINDVKTDLKGDNANKAIQHLKKLAGINCKTLHNKQVIFSEFKQGRWGTFFWNKKTGHLDASVEFEEFYN